MKTWDELKYKLSKKELLEALDYLKDMYTVEDVEYVLNIWVQDLYGKINKKEQDENN